jgi:hypothetical protein
MKILGVDCDISAEYSLAENGKLSFSGYFDAGQVDVSINRHIFQLFPGRLLLFRQTRVYLMFSCRFLGKGLHHKPTQGIVFGQFLCKLKKFGVNGLQLRISVLAKLMPNAINDIAFWIRRIIIY